MVDFMYRVIGDEVKIGEETIIWHFTNLHGCEIGHHCKIGSYTEIGTGVKVGNYVKIEAKVYIPMGVTIEDYAFVGPGVCFTNDMYPRSAEFVDGEPHLKEEFDMKRTLVKKGASIGAGSLLLPGVTIGKGALVGAGSVVKDDVPDFAVVVGTPSKTVGKVPDEDEYYENL